MFAALASACSGGRVREARLESLSERRSLKPPLEDRSLRWGGDWESGGGGGTSSFGR